MSRIKITILGTTAGVPTKTRAHPTLYISYDDGEEFCCLFDCGENAQRQCMVSGLNIMKIDHVFITHWHGDHCLGLPGIIDTMGFDERMRSLEIYAPEAGRIRRYTGFSYSMGKFRIKSHSVPSRGKKTTCALETERFRIVSVPVKHSVPAVAYAFTEKEKMCIDTRKAASLGLPEKDRLYGEVIEKGMIRLDDGRKITLEDISTVKKGKKVVYSGDTEICDNLKKLVEGADLLIQDCTYFEDLGPERQHKHATLPEVIEMASSGNVKRTVLTHISRKYQDKDQLKKLLGNRPGFEIAEDFMTVEI